MMFFPAVPVLFNDIYFVIKKNSIHKLRSYSIHPYQCTNNSHYDDFQCFPPTKICNNQEESVNKIRREKHKTLYKTTKEIFYIESIENKTNMIEYIKFPSRSLIQ